MIVTFVFRYGQPVAGMPQTGAAVATATSYPGTEYNLFSPSATPFLFLSLLHLPLLPNPPLQTTQLLLIRRSNPLNNKRPMVRTPTHSSR